jgi:hypothetical protein
MSENTVTPMGYGLVNDNDPELAGKQGSNMSFGLNVGTFKKLGYEPNGGKGGTPTDAFDMILIVDGKEFRNRFFDVTRVYDNSNNEITDVNSPIYIQNKNKTLNQTLGTITHAVKAVGVTEEALKQAFTTPVNSFADWCKVVTSLIPQNYSERPLHVFLEYQWNIPDGKDKTYLTLPQNMKGGRFLSSVLPGEWVEQKEWTETDEEGKIVSVKGLRYVNATQNVHPFVRTQDYMESNKGTQQTSATAANNGLSQQATVSTGSTW